MQIVNSRSIHKRKCNTCLRYKPLLLSNYNVHFLSFVHNFKKEQMNIFDNRLKEFIYLFIFVLLRNAGSPWEEIKGI